MAMKELGNEKKPTVTMAQGTCKNKTCSKPTETTTHWAK
jgi:hypothetical protein